MTSKAAVAVAQLCYFPLAFLGGLTIPPQLFRAWSVLMLSLALWASRRDEGIRFR